MEELGKMYKYIVLADGKPIFEGMNVKEMWKPAKAEYPNKKLSIRWEPPAGIFIA